MKEQFVKLEMVPNAGLIDLSRTALLIIDMQKDFLEPNGFGAALGNDVTKLHRAIGPCKAVLEQARKIGLLVIHTREGHRIDMTDVHRHKNEKKDMQGNITRVIGSCGPMGRVLIRGEPGHDIIPQLYPLATKEPIIDKPGKGSFYGTDLDVILAAQHISTLLVCGVTTEVCVHTTVREANDRGFHCIVICDACASYIDEFHRVALEMISAQGGIFGSVTTSEHVVKSLTEAN